jgi:hypothetical protein
VNALLLIVAVIPQDTIADFNLLKELIIALEMEYQVGLFFLLLSEEVFAWLSDLQDFVLV